MMRFLGDPLRAQTMFRQKGASDEETGGVGIGERVDVAAKLGAMQIRKGVGRSPCSYIIRAR